MKFALCLWERTFTDVENSFSFEEGIPVGCQRQVYFASAILVVTIGKLSHADTMILNVEKILL
jgi:hypothetical protein